MLTADQLAHYRQHECLIVKNIVPEHLLQGAQVAIERWVESEIHQWMEQGMLKNDFRDAPFNQRLMLAWNAAGRPIFNPNPTLEIAGPELHAILCHPLFVQLASGLFESPNVTASGVFHCRPNLPDQSLTDTPWHQDAQCCPNLAGTKFVIVWFPLMDVDENNACLQGAINRQHGGRLYKNYKDPAGYYISMNPDDVSHLQEIETFRMQRGDLLFFNEMLPHRAIPNHSASIRWSIDFRYYESSNRASLPADHALICAHTEPALVDASYATWASRLHLPIN